MTASEHTELLRDALRFVTDIDNSNPLARRLRSALATDGAEAVPVAWPGGDFVEYVRVHNIAISAYEAAIPPDYRYSAAALRKAVDAALTAALHPTSETTARLCATDGCERAGTQYFERGGVGSHYCPECIARIEALSEARHG